MRITTIVTEHPIASAAIGVFLFVQVIAFVRLVVAVRSARQRLGVSSKVESLQQKNRHKAGFDWIEWCRAQSLNGQISDSTEMREAALTELERWLATFPGYQLLQRTATMAPLLGVLLTAGGFLNLELPAGDDGPTRIISAISPLVVGVGGGASLAFFNQILLRLADSSVDRLRSLGGEWYDALNNWQRKESDSEPNKPSELLTAEALERTAGLNDSIASMLSDTREQSKKQIDQLTELSKMIAGQFGVLPDRLEQLTSTAEATSSTLGSLAPLISQITSGFSSSVSAFGDTVQNELSGALREHRQTVGDAAEITAACKSAVDQLTEGARLIEEVAQSQASATREYLEVLQQRILPQQQDISATAEKLEAIAEKLVLPLESLTVLVQAFSEKLGEGISGMEGMQLAASSFSKGIVEHFVPAAELHHKVLSGLEASASESGDSAAGLRVAVAHFADATEQLIASAEKEHKSLEQHALPAHALLERAALRFESSAETLTEHAESYRSALLLHAHGVQQLDGQVLEAIQGIASASQSLTEAVKSNLHEPLSSSAPLLRDLESVVSHISDAVQALRAGSQTMQQVSTEIATADGDFSHNISQSRIAITTLSEAAVELKSLVHDGMVTGQGEFTNAVRTLARTTEQLNGFLERGVDPLTERLQDLRVVVDELMGMMQRTAQLAEASQDAGRFLAAMDKAAVIAVALEALPKRIADEMERVVERHNDAHIEPTSRRSWFSRFSRS